MISVNLISPRFTPYLLSDPEPSRPFLFPESEHFRPLWGEGLGLPEWLLSLLERILAQLEYAEDHEVNAHFRDDIRIAWIKTLYASQENPQAFVDASYRVLGLHPDKVWPAILRNREAWLRNTYPIKRENAPGTGRLVAEEPSADGASSLPAYEFPSPKKPVQSVRRQPRERKAA